jgi:hypothetical protein
MYKSRTDKSSRSEAEVGTKATGFDSCGPYTCMDCVWKDHSTDGKEVVDVCTHPKVNADPELKSKKNKAGLVMIDQDDCCRFVRPPKGCK